MDKIFFWSEKEKFGFLSNFYASPITIDNKLWPTTEHYFQAMKTLDPIEQEKVRLAPTAYGSKKMGRKVKMRSDWESIRFEVMLTALRAKFQIPELKQKLKDTNDALIFEDSPFDKIWGTGVRGSEGSGQNLLGKALMIVRKELLDETL